MVTLAIGIGTNQFLQKLVKMYHLKSHLQKMGETGNRVIRRLVSRSCLRTSRQGVYTWTLRVAWAAAAGQDSVDRVYSAETAETFIMAGFTLVIHPPIRREGAV